MGWSAFATPGFRFATPGAILSRPFQGLNIPLTPYPSPQGEGNTDRRVHSATGRGATWDMVISTGLEAYRTQDACPPLGTVTPFPQVFLMLLPSVEPPEIEPRSPRGARREAFAADYTDWEKLLRQQGDSCCLNRAGWFGRSTASARAASSNGPIEVDLHWNEIRD